MKTASKSAPIHLKQDTLEVRNEIELIEALGVTVRRPTRFQIKVGPYNYYPTTGKIFVDGVGAFPGLGIQDFLALLQKENCNIDL